MKTLQRRQDNALSKYVGSYAELPQLLNSHDEEIRVLQTKYRNLNLQNREVGKRVLQKDKTINELNDRIKQLTQLNEDKYFFDHILIFNFLF